jgi:hypothetical protein
MYREIACRQLIGCLHYRGQGRGEKGFRSSYPQ